MWRADCRLHQQCYLCKLTASCVHWSYSIPVCSCVSINIHCLLGTCSLLWRPVLMWCWSQRRTNCWFYCGRNTSPPYIQDAPGENAGSLRNVKPQKCSHWYMSSIILTFPQNVFMIWLSYAEEEEIFWWSCSWKGCQASDHCSRVCFNSYKWETTGYF